MLFSIVGLFFVSSVTYNNIRFFFYSVLLEVFVFFGDKLVKKSFRKASVSIYNALFLKSIVNIDKYRYVVLKIKIRVRRIASFNYGDVR